MSETKRLSFLDLQTEGTVAPRERAPSVVLPIPHPNQARIVEILTNLKNGTEEDVVGAASQVEDLLLSDGPCLRVGQVRYQRNGRDVTDVQMFSLWASRPLEAEEKEHEDDNDGKMLARVVNTRVRLTQKVRVAAERRLGASRTGGQRAPAQIPEGRAPVGVRNQGDVEVEVE